MELEDQHEIAQGLSERLKRRIINQMAQHLANRHYEQARAQLQGQLDNAEMRGCAAPLLVEWQQRLQGYGERRAHV